MDNLIIKLVNMKKEEKSTPVSTKARSFYRYELQATNQILKDALDIYPYPNQSTAQSKHLHKNQLNQSEELYFDDNYFPKHSPPTKKQQSLPHSCRQVLLKEYPRKAGIIKVLQEKKTFAGRNMKQTDNIYEKWFQQQKAKGDESSSSNNSFWSQLKDSNKKPSCYIDKSKEICYKKDGQQQNKKQLRRQRRGLANISLKVKNIVAKKGKMTFKQVSDEVLKQSQQDLPQEPEEREKQTKNIRRRVYDALNVLVSVGILGKQQRCVVHTQFTNIPGKKLSVHWQIITEKQEILRQCQINYEKKLAHLKQIKNSYELVLMLQERNKKISKCKKQENAQQHNKMDKIKNSPNFRMQKLYFPLILLIPLSQSINKMKVQIQYDEKHPQNIKKFMVQGNFHLITDLEVLSHLPLRSQCISKLSAKPNQLLFLSNNAANLKQCFPEIQTKCKQQKSAQKYQQQYGKLDLNRGESECDGEFRMSIGDHFSGHAAISEDIFLSD